MSKELVISADRHETRVAVLEEDQLVEVHFQRSNEYSLAGSIHKGRVTRVLPGMQSAFVDVGLERDTFLYVSDFLDEHEDIDQVTGDEQSTSNAGGSRDRDKDRDRDRRGRRGRRGGRERGSRDGERSARPEGRSEEEGEGGSEAEARGDSRTDSRTDSRNDSRGEGRVQVGMREGAGEDAEQVRTAAAEAGSAGTDAAAVGEGETAERGDRESRDRKGRRGRRRRGRRETGGLPESKYADASQEEPEESAAGGSEDEIEMGAAEAAMDDETSLPPIVLPGESLAKYRRAAPAPLQEKRQERLPETRDEKREDRRDDKRDDRHAAAKASGSAAPAGREAPESDEEEVDPNDLALELEYEEPIHRPVDNALPDGPSHPLPAEGEASAEDEEAVAELALSGDAGAEDVDSDEDSDDSDDDTPRASWLDEGEDLDIQEMILSASGLDDDSDDSDDASDGDASDDASNEDASGDDATAESGSESESAVSAQSDGGEEDSEAAKSGQSAEDQPREARVRGRGGRFTQRLQRRSRRRGRSQSSDSEATGEAATGEGAAAVETESSAPESTGELSAGAGAAPVAVEDPTRDAAADDSQESRGSGRDSGRESGEDRSRGRRPDARRRVTGNQGQPSISELLKQGQEIIVQIAKEPLGQKGARITSHVALPGRFVVYMPTLHHMGVSRKIGSDEERLRLKKVLQGKRPGEVGGFITRTAAEGRSEEEIGADMEFLYNLWQDIRTKADKKPAPQLLHHDLDIVQRVLRDQLTDDFKAIWIDNEDMYEKVLKFVERFQPALVGKVKLYTREAPIFDSFGVTLEMEKALRPKVWLKSGGYIVINQTEALVAIDVNTGKFVGRSNRLEDTIVKTNTEAIKEIVRQVRLRDLGGIIVIDFIDMDERKNRQKVMQALEEAMRVDRAPYKILQFNDFGLVAITRKRVKQSLERTLCSPCPHCDGAGYVKSVQTVVSEILTEARKIAPTAEGKDMMLRVNPDVAKIIKSHKNKYLEELEEVLRRPVLVKSDPLLHHEKFDLA